MTGLRLEDLRHFPDFDSSVFHGEPMWKASRPVTAAEVASACPTETLIAVLVERGVLTREEDQYWPPATHVDGPMKIARLVTEWKPGVSVPRPAGGVS